MRREKVCLGLARNPVSVLILGMALSLPAAADSNRCDRHGRGNDHRIVRAAVIGGMTQEVALWPEIARQFEERTGYQVELVATGGIAVIADAFEAGQADLITVHSSDPTTNLVADGYGVHMQPWAHNELVLMGPASDPAGVRGMTSGVEALKKIAAAGTAGTARFVDLWGTGKREMSQDLWSQTGVYPVNKPWFVKDGSSNEMQQLVYTASLGNAYALFGRIPVITGKVNTAGLQIMVQGDPGMQRPYIVIEANPQKFPCANDKGAQKLAEFLVSRRIQSFLPTYLVDEFFGLPPFYPLRSGAFRQ